MQQPSDGTNNRQPPDNRRSLTDHDSWWSQFGSREAFLSWLCEWKPNLAIHLVPQVKSLSAKQMIDIGDRWCNRTQTTCFGRNRRKHNGQIILFAEFSEAVGWHLHGVASMPAEAASKPIHSGEEWLREESTAFLTKTVDPRFESEFRIDPTASIYTLSTEADRNRTINYAVKEWSAHGKWDRVVLSGRHSPRA